MDFTLSKQHEMARTLFSEFAEKEVKPLAQEVDETEKFPRETVEKMAKAGFLGIPVPKELGGRHQHAGNQGLNAQLIMRMKEDHHEILFDRMRKYCGNNACPFLYEI